SGHVADFLGNGLKELPENQRQELIIVGLPITALACRVHGVAMAPVENPSALGVLGAVHLITGLATPDDAGQAIPSTPPGSASSLEPCLDLRLHGGKGLPVHQGLVGVLFDDGAGPFVNGVDVGGISAVALEEFALALAA